jgi:tetratricopeptide (TPR) repeat protein
VQLVESGTGHQVWSERYDRPIGDLFDLQRAISQEVVAQLAIEVTAAERERLAKRYTRNLEAYDYFLRGQVDLLLRQREANRSAREWYRKAIERDPAFARAYAGLALSYIADYRNQWNEDRSASLQHATAMASSALQIDPDIPQVHWVLGYVAAQKRQHEEALARLRHALELDQSYADAYALMGGINTYKGQPAKSVPLLREAIRLRPDAGYLYYLLLGRAYFFLGDQEQSLINLREALARNPTNLEARVYLAAAEVANRDLDGAEWEADEIRTLKPDFDISAWFETYPMTDPGQISQLSGALESAGL